MAPCSMLALLAAALLLCVASAENVVVTCGTSLKIMHLQTKTRLHSHQVSYSRGSQQQSVTGFPDADDGNSMWIVYGSTDEPCVPGTPIKKGGKLRLLHAGTRKWLHSHMFYSPLSNNQEVSAFGSDTQSDAGDNWSVEWDTKGKMWKQNTKFRLRHVETGNYLFSHDTRYGNPIANQAEVACVGAKNKGTEWQAAEGVYYPVGGADAEEASKEEL